MSEERFRVLHALKVRGLADDAALCEITGMDEAAAKQTVGDLAEAGAVRQRKGRVGGYALTADGRAQHAALHDEYTDAEATTAAERAYEAFLPHNGTFKQLCTQWQTKADERDVITFELSEIQAELNPSLEALGRDVPRFSRYPDRFEALMTRIRDGEPDAFLKPMTGSYHDVWMELHEDLLLATGRERGEHDE